MGILDRFRLKSTIAGLVEPQGVTGVFIKEAEPTTTAANSSPVSDESGISDVVHPDIPFEKCYEYGFTIGQVQNAVDSLISKVITRDWYFAPAKPDEDQEQYKRQIELLDEWEDQLNLSGFFEQLIRDWLLCGTHIIGRSDWKPMQLSSVDGCKRDPKTGEIQQYRFLHNGNPINLPASKYIKTDYIEADRRAWGYGAFHAIFNDKWTDTDIRGTPKSIAAIIRVMQQDSAKIHHKFASPRVIYGFENVNKEVFDRDISPLISKLKAGDRLALSKLPTLVQETVDGNARFTDSIDLINAELKAGLQASTNSVMQGTPFASGKIGDMQDDERTLALMEKIRRVMDVTFIPEVIGEQYKGKIIFKWGKQDDFDYNPSELQVWVEQGAISVGELRNILKAQGVKLDDKVFAKDTAEKEAKQKDMMDQKAAQRSGTMSNNNKVTEELIKAIDKVAGNSNNDPPPFLEQELAIASLKADIQQQLDTAFKKIDEFNPYHDEAGRFSDSSGATGEVSVARPSKQTLVQQTNRADIKARSKAVKTLLANAVDYKTYQKASTYSENDQGLISNQKKVVLEAGMMVMSPKQLASTRLLISQDERVNLPDGRAALGYHIGAFGRQSDVDSINQKYGTQLKDGDIVIALGERRTREDIKNGRGQIVGYKSGQEASDSFKTYSTVIHESHHHIEQEMRYRGTTEEMKAIRTWDEANRNLGSEHKNRIGELGALKAFEIVHGSYGLEHHEQMTTMAQSYYAYANYGFNVDPGRFMDVKDRIANNEFGERYYERAEQRFPQLKEIHDAFREIQRVNGN